MLKRSLLCLNLKKKGRKKKKGQPFTKYWPANSQTSAFPKEISLFKAETSQKGGNNFLENQVPQIKIQTIE